MTISNQDEYKLSSGQTISIQKAKETNKWEVGCWNEDGSAQWYWEFDDEVDARVEFERWRK